MIFIHITNVDGTVYSFNAAAFMGVEPIMNGKQYAAMFSMGAISRLIVIDRANKDLLIEGLSPGMDRASVPTDVKLQSEDASSTRSLQQRCMPDIIAELTADEQALLDADRGKHAAYMREWRKTHRLTAEQRHKDNCRSYAGVYKRRGYLIPEPCQVCGLEQSQMHHEDYDKPLNVMWLCRPCHLDLHHGERASA